MSKIDWEAAARLALGLDGWNRTPDFERIKGAETSEDVPPWHHGETPIYVRPPDPLDWAVIEGMLFRHFPDRDLGMYWESDEKRWVWEISGSPKGAATGQHADRAKAALQAFILAKGERMPLKGETDAGL